MNRYFTIYYFLYRKFESVKKTKNQLIYRGKLAKFMSILFFINLYIPAVTGATLTTSNVQALLLDDKKLHSQNFIKTNHGVATFGRVAFNNLGGKRYVLSVSCDR